MDDDDIRSPFLEALDAPDPAGPDDDSPWPRRRLQPDMIPPLNPVLPWGQR